ncbi:MAG TPA: Omp28-related outer membrane protein [Ignavibacteriaceae bacterium]|nr:Omp28-related outer membrane protein [Ignavibacteriaceae bacterium]
MQNLLRFVVPLVIFLCLGSSHFAQTQRNPVLEFCTGTWCQWCPCGDDIIIENILPNIPNAIILAYHGAGSDPFRIFPGSNIINLLGFTGYPTGTIDRVSSVLVWNQGWDSWVNNRNSVPATVSIDITRSYDQSTRQFTATVDFTALQNLNGQYSFNIILVEDGQVWGQTSNNTCTPGITFIPDYVHYWLVRDMMNGATGEEVINGPWNQGQVITKTISRTFSVPPAPAPDFVPDSSGIVVLIYKNGSPLNSNAEIQQAEQWTLISPDYVATITSTSDDVIADKFGTAEFSVELMNEGLLDDSYYVNVNMEAPAGWTGEYTTANGTFQFGQQDLLAVSSEETAEVSLVVTPNAINGYGEITVQFSSLNDPNINVSTKMRVVTSGGVEMLVVDASGEGYGSLVMNSLENVFTGSYGMVSRAALTPGIDLTNFYEIVWSAGINLPVFYPEEVTALQEFLDSDGRLLINGQDIGKDIFEATGQSQFAQDFYHNYLHTDYIADDGPAFFLIGIDGDPITNGVNFALGLVYDKSPDEMMPYDSDATSIFKFSVFPNFSSTRVETQDYRVVYFGFGFEQIDDQAIRDTLMARSIAWLKEGLVVSTPGDENTVRTFSLDQNYPNPFNPSTTINYSLEKDVHVSLKVYDIMGSEVAELINKEQSAGVHQVLFDASAVASGMYFYKLSAGDFVSVKKMTLLK